MTDEPFKLEIQHEKKPVFRPDNSDRNRQGKLFLGSHTDLPGQGELFDPNGEDSKKCKDE